MNADFLHKYNLPQDLKKLSLKQLQTLSDDIRQYIISSVHETGGHLASSLGVVELSVALHAILDSPKDKIIWDVGHQCYPHKLLTGRDINNIRTYGGISGFTNRQESEHDCFGAGHASTSISAALGIAKARDIKNQDFSVFAVIGDSSMSGGLAFEGLNNSHDVSGNLVVVLNDNNMSIGKPVGALSKTITSLRLSKFYTGLKRTTEKLLKALPIIGKPLAHQIETIVHRTGAAMINEVSDKSVSGFFQDLGFTYIGPIDGHNIPLLMSAISYSKLFKKGPIILHVRTTKGLGFKPAEDDPIRYHGVSCAGAKKSLSYTNIFGKSLVEFARDKESIVAITAAMPDGTGLNEFKENFPKRFFDVGIAEAHAVTFAGGLATQGLKPVVAVYSSFLQRAYDQVIHDIALQNLPVIFAIDRAGLVGEDGPTHHGSFDISFLRTVPGLVVSAPKDGNELKDLLLTAINYDGPIALRYPRGEAYFLEEERAAIALKIGEWEVLKGDFDNDIVCIATGRMVKQVLLATGEVDEVTVINARFIKPLDTEMLEKLAGKRIYVFEEGVSSGGLAEAIKSYFSSINSISLPDEFVTYGDIDSLFKETKLDAEAIKKQVLDD